MNFHASALALLALQRAGTTDAKIIDLAKSHPELLKSETSFGAMLSDFAIAAPTQEHWDRAASILEQSTKHGIDVLSYLDERYPWFLRLIPDPPPLLHVKGSLTLVSSTIGVAVVGTRDATPTGLEIARRIALYMSERGWPIVSGLAKGIDRSAHSGCLQGPTPTIAVLAHGLHKCSPKANADIGLEILDRGGAWVSEQPVGQEPRKHFFVPRNRIQVGLSAGSVIVEAARKSGTMTQANFCLKQGKPLFAVVPFSDAQMHSLHSEGTEELVRKDDALPIRSREDYELLETLMQSSRDNLERKVKRLFPTPRSLI